jgi:hypothetical protein
VLPRFRIQIQIAKRRDLKILSANLSIYENAAFIVDDGYVTIFVDNVATNIEIL